MEIRPVQSPEDLAEAKRLMRDYATTPGVNECVVGFAAEIDGLPGRYGPPSGVLLLALDEGGAIGCGGLRGIAPGVAEIKRLYVDPRARGTGAGRALAQAIVAAARGLGYSAVRLDTLPSMRAAIALYGSLGFRRIDAYPGSTGTAMCFEVAL
jgi:GNAT superfamily N-acetyltransferase